jgi:hypothetical protein
VGRLGAVPDPATMGAAAADPNRSDCHRLSPAGGGTRETRSTRPHPSTARSLATQLAGTARPQCSPPNCSTACDHAPRSSDDVGAVFGPGCRESGVTTWNVHWPFSIPGRCSKSVSFISIGVDLSLPFPPLSFPYGWQHFRQEKRRRHSGADNQPFSLACFQLVAYPVGDGGPRVFQVAHRPRPQCL